MPASNAGLTNKVLAVYVKDLRLELRSRYGLNAIFMFGISSLTVISFSVGQAALSTNVLSALYWVVVFFSALSVMAQVFLREEESGTAMALRLSPEQNTVYLGQLFFILTLLCCLVSVCSPLFLLFAYAPIGGIVNFLLVMILGVLDLCAATTLIAAIIARASVKGALFAVLSFPILLPVLIVLVSATDKVWAGSSLAEVSKLLQFLLAYVVIMVTASLMLFKFVWED